MAVCEHYIVPPGFQLQSGGATGPYDCTAWSASRAIGHATCGAKVPSGRTIRLRSSEPVPDPKSPGLNLPQVGAVALQDFGVFLDIRIGSQRVTWAEYERRRLVGQGCIIQLRYAPIADSKYDAGRGFRGNHALFESIHATYDPLADGRYAGCFRWNGTVYVREVIKRAAGLLDTGGGTKPGYGYVWAAFTKSVLPNIHWGADVLADIRGTYTALAVASKLRSLGITNFGDAINLSDLEAGLKKRGINYGTSVQLVDVQALMKPGTGA